MEGQLLKLPPYTSKNNTKENRKMANDLIKQVLTSNAEMFTDQQMQRSGRVLASAVIFNCEKDYQKAIKFILKLLCTYKKYGEKDIEHIWGMKLLYITTLKRICSRVDAKFVPNLKLALTDIVRHYFNNVTNAVSAVKALNYIVQNFGQELEVNIILSILSHDLTNLSSKLIYVPRFIRASIASLLYELDTDNKIIILINLLSTQPWFKAGYIIAGEIIKTISMYFLSNYNVYRLLCAVRHGLSFSHLSHDAAFLFELLIERCSLEQFQEQCFGHVMEWSQIKEKHFILNYYRYIINTCVKQYQLTFYNDVYVVNKDSYMLAHIIYYCVRNGYASATEFEDAIETLLEDHDLEVRNKMFLTLCLHLKTSLYIPKWNINVIERCIEMKSVDFNHKFLQKSYKEFTTKLCKCVIRILKTDDSDSCDELLITYSNHIKFIFYTCYLHIDINTRESLIFARYLNNILHDIFSKEIKNYGNANIKKYGNNKFVSEMHSLRNNFIKACTSLLLEKFNDEYFSHEAYTIEDDVMHFDTADCKKLLSTLKKFISHGNYDSGEKCKQIVMIFIKKNVMEQTDISNLITTLRDTVKEQVRKFFYQNNSLENSPIFSALGSWNLLLQNINIDVLPIEIVQFMFRSAEYMIEYNLLNLNNSRPSITDKKIKEHIIINGIQVMANTILTGKLHPNFLDYFLTLAENVITYSNLKRPVVATEICYKTVLEKIATNEITLNLILEKKLNNVLYLNVTTQTIRKCPQSRIIIKHIALADKSDEKTIVKRTMNFLLSVIDTKRMKNPSAVASALFTLEGIINEKSITSIISPYATDLLIQCFEKFNSEDFTVKNAAMQLLQTLTVKLLGQTSDVDSHPVTSQDFFLTHKSLTHYIILTLKNANYDNNFTVIAILMFLSEIVSIPNCLESKHNVHIKNSFLKIIINLVKNEPTQTGYYAAKAFVSLIDLHKIPNMISDTINYIKRDLSNLSKNVLSHLLDMTNNMNERYINHVSNEHNKDVLEIAITDLNNYIKESQFDENLYPLLKVEIITFEEILEETKILLSNVDNLTKKNRNKIFSNLKLVLTEIDAIEFDEIITLCLNNSSITFQTLVLKTVLERMRKRSNDNAYINVTNVINIIAKFLFENNNLCLFLFRTICYVIVMLTENAGNTYQLNVQLYELLLKNYILTYGTRMSPIYVYVALLAKKDALNNCDFIIINNALISCERDINSDSIDDRKLLCITLMNFHKFIPVEKRPNLLKIAVTLLVENDDDNLNEVHTYLASALGIRYNNSDIPAIYEVVDLKLLTSYFNSATAAKEFLYDLVSLLIDDAIKLSVQKNTFYCFKKSPNKKVILLNKIFQYLSDIGEFPYMEFIFAVSEKVVS